VLICTLYPDALLSFGHFKHSFFPFAAVGFTDGFFGYTLTVTFLDAFPALMVIVAIPVFLIVTFPVFLFTATIFGFELVNVILPLDDALILNGAAP
jgi:uncharacterized membrane protein